MKYRLKLGRWSIFADGGTWERHETYRNAHPHKHLMGIYGIDELTEGGSTDRLHKVAEAYARLAKLR